MFRNPSTFGDDENSRPVERANEPALCPAQLVESAVDVPGHNWAFGPRLGPVHLFFDTHGSFRRQSSRTITAGEQRNVSSLGEGGAGEAQTRSLGPRHARRASVIVLERDGRPIRVHVNHIDDEKGAVQREEVGRHHGIHQAQRPQFQRQWQELH